MATTDEESHKQCMQRFVELANAMKEEGVESRVVSAGLMTASAVYATYVFAGNNGLLTEKGIEGVTAGYKQQLEQVQVAKVERHEKRSA